MRRAAITFILLIVGIGCAGLVFRRLGDRLCGQECFRLGRPAPYAHADYFSREFILETWRYPGPRLSPEGVLTVENFEGQWVNARQGQRVTTGQPVSSPNRAWVFGSSSIEGLEVPDHLTIPSQLQVQLGARLKVENLGYSGASTEHFLRKLKSLPLKAGDVVIFYDGINEALRTLLLRDQIHGIDDPSYEEAFQNAFVGYAKHAFEAVRRARRTLLVFPVFEELLGTDPALLIQDFVPAHFESSEEMGRLRSRLEKSFLADTLEARRLSESKGARFYQFFQPFLGSARVLSEYERQLEARPGVVPRSFLKALSASLPVYRIVDQRLKEAGVASTLLDQALSDRPPGEEVFLDCCHLNHLGNQMIASRLAQAIEPKLDYPTRRR